MSHARRDLIALLIISLAVRLLVACFIDRPGYMDAAYYAAGAVQLAQSGQLEEPFIWNYLDAPSGIPHPGYSYWMPLPSLIAAPAAALLPGSFLVLQLPFVLLSALLPLVTYLVAWRAAGRPDIARLAAAVTLFSGFFLPYWTLPETFAPFALFSSLAIWLGGGPIPHLRSSRLRWLVAGLLVGLAHLSRADGVILLVPAGIIAPLLGRRPGASRSTVGRLIADSSLVFLGYGLVMAPWFLRNLHLTGSLLSPGGTQTLWLQTYDDLFCYQCDLSLRSFVDWGWKEILHSKLWAAEVNLERFLAEDCLIFLLPFTLLGLYRLRRQPTFILALVTLVIIYCVHSFAFTFPGPRGGFFHSSAALLPFLHASAAEGFERAVRWAGQRRRWNVPQARRVFSASAVVLALLLSVYVAAGRLEKWRTSGVSYQEIDQWLTRQPEAGAAEPIVMVVNPPAFWYHTHRPCLAVPNGPVEELLAAADRYSADYLVLEPDRPAALSAIYEGSFSPQRLSLVHRVGETKVYRIRR
jgi:hypothetical protein